MNNVLAYPQKSSKMTRREKRNQELQLRKLKRRTYTYEEMEQIVSASCEEMEQEYDKIYTAGMAVVLNSEPTNFGPKRVCRTMGLFFEQIYAMRQGIVDEDQIVEAAKKLGIIITHTENGLEVLVNDHSKEKKKEVDIKFNHDPNGPKIEVDLVEKEEGLYIIRKNEEETE